MGMSTANGSMDHLIRSEIWSAELKQNLEDQLMATSYVRWLTEFPDGDTFTIPSIGDLPVRDYTEDEAVQYDQIDTGEFQFSINEYVSSATYITNKAKQDSFYMNELVSNFVPKQGRAIAEHVEEKILGLSGSQTASNINEINGAAHRFVGGVKGGGTAGTIQVNDFAYAGYALTKARVPESNRVAIVSPEVGYILETITNITQVTNNPMYEGIINTGITAGARFIRNIYGFDVYVSDRLRKVAKESITHDGGARTVATDNQVECMFFSADSSILPFIGAWRQMPTVDSEYNKDKQRDEYVTTARYDCALYRPENLVVVLCDESF